MNKIDILCMRISADATALKGITEILNSCRAMTLSEVELIGAERHLADALNNVQELLGEYRKNRKESA